MEPPKEINQSLDAYLADKISIYIAAMDHEQSIRTNYQALLLTLETILFGLFSVLLELKVNQFTPYIGSAGLALSLVFLVACEFRAKNVDFWRCRIIDISQGTAFENDFRGARYGSYNRQHPFFTNWKPGRQLDWFFGHWFERIIIPLISILWAVELFYHF